MTLGNLMPPALISVLLPGTVPDTISRYSALEVLVLRTCGLSGEWSSAATRVFPYSHCHMTGVLPESLTELTSLKHVDFSDNALAGKSASSQQCSL